MGAPSLQTKPNQDIPAKKGSGINLRQYSMMIALIAIFIVFSIATGNKMTTPMNINNLIMQNSYVVILACGMVLCILTGNVNLSVGSVVAFTGAISAILVLDYGLPIPLAFLIVLVIGALIGVWQGFFIARLEIPAFIVTLADMLIFRGLTMVILKGQTKGPLPGGFVYVGAGYLPQWFATVGGKEIEMISIVAGLAASAIIVLMELQSRANKRRYNFALPPVWQMLAKLIVIIFVLNFITYKLASYKGLPVVLAILLGLILIYSFVTQNTVAGRHIYAVGGNMKAARLSGIKVKNVLFWVYVNMGFLCAMAGIVLSGRNASATPKAGDGFELDAMASCYIGGASASGGIGTVVGAVVGALIMGVLNNGMSLLGWSTDWQKVVKGLVLLGAAVFDHYNTKRA